MNAIACQILTWQTKENAMFLIDIERTIAKLDQSSYTYLHTYTQIYVDKRAKNIADIS